MSGVQKFSCIEQLLASVTSKNGLFDLEKHFAFYGAHHTNPINILIHIFCTGPVLLTNLILFHFTPTILRIPLWFGDHVLDLNLGFVIAVSFGLYYMLLDKRAGSLAALLSFLCWIGSGYLADGLGFSLAWKVVLVTQLFCWTLQFLGHAIFEKRAPAASHNPIQALTTAPFFLFLEVLKFTCQYEPFPGFYARITAKIQDDLKERKIEMEKKMS